MYKCDCMLECEHGEYTYLRCELFLDQGARLLELLVMFYQGVINELQ